MHFRPLSPEPAALIRQLCASCYVCRNLASPPEGQVDAGQTTPCSGPGIQLGSSVRRHRGVDACLCSLRPGVASPSRLRAPRTHPHTRTEHTLPRRHSAPHFNVPRKESIVPLPHAVTFLSGCRTLARLFWRCLCLNQHLEHFLPKPVASEPITDAAVVQERS